MERTSSVCSDMDRERKAHAYIYINDICNQRCLFCSRPPGGVSISSRHVMEKIDECAAGGITKVVLTGGEPTLHPELQKYVAYAASKGLEVDVQTNGSVIDHEGWKKLHDAGLRSVSFAYTSHLREVSDVLRGVPSGFPEIERGLRGAIGAGLRLHLVVVITKLNMGHLEEIVRHISSFEIPKGKLRINFMMICPTGAAWENKDLIIPSPRDAEHDVISACDRCVRLGIGFDISEVVPLCAVHDHAHAVSSTCFINHDVRIIDDNYKRGELDFSCFPEDVAAKSPRCKSCSLDRICVGTYPRIMELFGEEILVPSDTDPKVITDKVATRGRMLSLDIDG